MSHEPVTIKTDDQKEALRQIANYLRFVRLDDSRAVMQRYTHEHSEFLGYWQTEKYLRGLIEIANECDRIVSIN